MSRRTAEIAAAVSIIVTGVLGVLVGVLMVGGCQSSNDTMFVTGSWLIIPALGMAVVSAVFQALAKR